MNKNPITIKNSTAFKRQRNYCLSKKKKQNLSTTTLQKGGITTKKNFELSTSHSLKTKDFKRTTILHLLKKIKL